MISFLTISSISNGKELRVGVGNFEPFFIKKTESGVFFDLINETFKLLPQYNLKFIVTPNKALNYWLENNHLDVACNILKKSSSNIYLSDKIFRYLDVAITLKKNRVVIDSIHDLNNKSIATYQGATDFLGNDFKQMALSNKNYKEYANTSITTNLLAMNRVEVRVGDVNIFIYQLSSPLLHGKVKEEDFKIHYLWPLIYSFIGFRDKNIRNEFNDALKKIKANGTHIERVSTI